MEAAKQSAPEGALRDISNKKGYSAYLQSASSYKLNSKNTLHLTEDRGSQVRINPDLVGARSPTSGHRARAANLRGRRFACKRWWRTPSRIA
ncbi:hypothetical protein [Acidovorax sp. 1608163]|uniref:hypothetical protein n=1 Tax=Acidovorax sp. 1608163 TaxID=2478662 RepID=UPI0013CE6286|nr:hypothetical protein [Acidovorax sp. 1608163]